MIVDGKSIAEEIFSDLKEQVASLPRKPVLSAIVSAPNFETKKFLALKKKKADEIGVAVEVIELPHDVTTESAIAAIKKAVGVSDGIVVQLPFPEHIDRDALIVAIPETHDVDAFLLKDEKVLPPVVGAVAEVLKSAQVEVGGKKAVVVGKGRLVGLPVFEWLIEKGAEVEVVAKDTPHIASHTKDADIIVLGAGSPGLLTTDMIKEGVVILDAGTSEEGGKLHGDADPRCALKASLFTPVPGGIGPITVAVLLRNLVVLSSRK